MLFLIQCYSFIDRKLLAFAMNVNSTFRLAIGIEVYSYETLGKIAAVATFRTLLAYFLAKDYREKTQAGQEKAL
jgi:uncharacterized membrane protein